MHPTPARQTPARRRRDSDRTGHRTRVIRPDRVALVLRSPGDPGRDRFERYVHQRYRLGYGADLRSYLDELMAIVDVRDEILGVIGTASARGRSLFLEQYLDEPVERPLSRAVGAIVQRERIAEVGNLASHVAGGGRVLVTAFASFLAGCGAEWAVFTGTRALRNGFERLGVTMHDLGPADAAAVARGATEWGSYYDADPRVTTVRIEHVHAAALSDPRLTSLGEAARLLGRLRADEVGA